MTFGQHDAAPLTRTALGVTQLDVTPDVWDTLSALLSPDEGRRACRFKFERDRRRYTVARARLRQWLAPRLGVPPQDIEFDYGAHGKPTLGGHFAKSRLRFNVSHCEELAVYVFAIGCEVGIDVERIRPLPDADDIAQRFFSAAEHAAYRALDRGDQPLGFFNCWTRKEAFVKALGLGLDYPLDRFDVSLSPGAPATIRRIDDARIVPAQWSLNAFTPAPGFVGALAVQNPGAATLIPDRLPCVERAAPVLCD